MASTHSEDHFEGFHDMKSLKTLLSPWTCVTSQRVLKRKKRGLDIWCDRIITPPFDYENIEKIKVSFTSDTPVQQRPPMDNKKGEGI